MSIIKNTDFQDIKNTTLLEFGFADIHVIEAHDTQSAVVAFKNEQGEHIGASSPTNGLSLNDIKPEVVMLFSNPLSIDVVINALEKAKAALAGRLPEIASAYATKCHSETNHTYDKWPYSTHLELVYEYGKKYIHLVPEELRPAVLAACWTHDVIEDCRQTYNDVKQVCGEQVAEITYALTNEKGKTRSERASKTYYDGIKNIEGARFVKLCDRLANIKWSKDTTSSMLDKYRKEQPDFYGRLFGLKYFTMFEEMFEMLEQ